MNNQLENLIKLRDIYKDLAAMIDELLKLEERETEGEDVIKEYEALVGRFIMRSIEAQRLNIK